MANVEGIDDSFDEVFKLIYAKLYDEWAAANDRTRYTSSSCNIFIATNPAFAVLDDYQKGYNVGCSGTIVPGYHPVVL